MFYSYILQLWDHYDADHSGFLDLIELKVMVRLSFECLK